MQFSLGKLSIDMGKMDDIPKIFAKILLIFFEDEEKSKDILIKLIAGLRISLSFLVL